MNQEVTINGKCNSGIGEDGCIQNFGAEAPWNIDSRKPRGRFEDNFKLNFSKIDFDGGKLVELDIVSGAELSVSTNRGFRG
jgi:hypothetical protein